MPILPRRLASFRFLYSDHPSLSPQHGRLFRSPQSFSSSLRHFCFEISTLRRNLSERKSYLSHPEDRHFFLVPDQWNIVLDHDLETPDHFVIWFLTIIFVQIEIQNFQKFIRIEVSDGSGGFLNSGSPSG